MPINPNNPRIYLASRSPRRRELLAQIGGNEFALGAASWNARRWLGHPGIEEGAPADIVVFAEDPRVTISVVREPVLIILNGRVVGGSAAN